MTARKESIEFALNMGRDLNMSCADVMLLLRNAKIYARIMRAARIRDLTGKEATRQADLESGFRRIADRYKAGTIMDGQIKLTIPSGTTSARSICVPA